MWKTQREKKNISRAMKLMCDLHFIIVSFVPIFKIKYLVHDIYNLIQLYKLFLVIVVT